MTNPTWGIDVPPPTLLLVLAFARFPQGAVAAKSCEPISSASVQMLVVSNTSCNPNPDREYNPGILNMTLSLPYRVPARCQGTRCPQRATAVVAEASTKPVEKHSLRSRASTLRKAADDDVSTDLIFRPEKSWKRSCEH